MIIYNFSSLNSNSYERARTLKVSEISSWKKWKRVFFYMSLFPSLWKNTSASQNSELRMLKLLSLSQYKSRFWDT